MISDDCVDSGRGVESYDYAREHGVTLRDDSILVYRYRHNDLAQKVWPKMPVILESVDYPGLTAKWGDGSELLEAVEDYHASSVSIDAYLHRSGYDTPRSICWSGPRKQLTHLIQEIRDAVAIGAPSVIAHGERIYISWTSTDDQRRLRQWLNNLP